MWKLAVYNDYEIKLYLLPLKGGQLHRLVFDYQVGPLIYNFVFYIFMLSLTDEINNNNNDNNNNDDDCLKVETYTN